MLLGQLWSALSYICKRHSQTLCKSLVPIKACIVVAPRQSSIRRDRQNAFLIVAPFPSRLSRYSRLRVEICRLGCFERAAAFASFGSPHPLCCKRECGLAVTLYGDSLRCSLPRSPELEDAFTSVLTRVIESGTGLRREIAARPTSRAAMPANAESSVGELHMG
jgi:hypothetical protein